MKTRPTVFLCHSKKDRKFIERIANELRLCRVDSWYDDWEIPPGKPFQRKIFEEGIPECDSFFIYLSEASIQSFWVQKEFDAATIQENRERRSKIITFVSGEDIRGKLRSDIASLHSPVINGDKEYHTGFIRLLAAIYENQIRGIEKEKSLEAENTRLRLEKDVEKLKSQIISLQGSGSKTMEKLHEELSQKMIVDWEKKKVSALQIFETIVKIVATPTWERDLWGIIASEYSLKIELSNSEVSLAFYPLIYNDLVKIHVRDTPDYKEPRTYLYLTDFGKKFALFLEEKTSS